MSQIYVPTTSSIPSIPTSFVTDIGGPAVPVANVINIVTPGSGTQGISTTGSGNTITIALTDITLTGTAQTIGTSTANINVNVPLPVTNSAVSLRANISGYAKSSGLAVGGELIASMINVAGVLSVIGIPDLAKNNSVALAAWSATITSSGTNVIIQVTGVATYTINWTAIIDYVIATEAQA